MKEYALVFIFSAFLWQSYWLDVTEDGNKVLTKDLKETIAKHNAINHKLIKANERIEELSTANEALIEHCNPIEVNNAIKHTKLPQLKGC